MRINTARLALSWRLSALKAWGQCACACGGWQKGRIRTGVARFVQSKGTACGASLPRGYVRVGARCAAAQCATHGSAVHTTSSTCVRCTRYVYAPSEYSSELAMMLLCRATRLQRWRLAGSFSKGSFPSAAAGSNTALLRLPHCGQRLPSFSGSRSGDRNTRPARTSDERPHLPFVRRPRHAFVPKRNCAKKGRSAREIERNLFFHDLHHLLAPRY